MAPINKIVYKLEKSIFSPNIIRVKNAIPFVHVYFGNSEDPGELQHFAAFSSVFDNGYSSAINISYSLYLFHSCQTSIEGYICTCKERLKTSVMSIINLVIKKCQ